MDQLTERKRKKKLVQFAWLPHSVALFVAFFFCPIKLRNQTESIFHFQMMYIHTRSPSIFTVVTHFLLMFFHLLIYDSSSKKKRGNIEAHIFFFYCVSNRKFQLQYDAWVVSVGRSSKYVLCEQQKLLLIKLFNILAQIITA